MGQWNVYVGFLSIFKDKHYLRSARAGHASPVPRCDKACTHNCGKLGTTGGPAHLAAEQTPRAI